MTVRAKAYRNAKGRAGIQISMRPEDAQEIVKAAKGDGKVKELVEQLTTALKDPKAKDATD